MIRPSVVKREGAWTWECRSTCPRGGKGYRSQPAALSACLRHLAEHATFGLRPQR